MDGQTSAIPARSICTQMMANRLGAFYVPETVMTPLILLSAFMSSTIKMNECCVARPSIRFLQEEHYRGVLLYLHELEASLQVLASRKSERWDLHKAVVNYTLQCTNW